MKEYMKPENGLFLLWENARENEKLILEDIRKNFTILDMEEIQWDDSNFSKNLTRFYGKNLLDCDEKELHIGKGAFLLIVAQDSNPKYEPRKTSNGEKEVNINFFDKKTYYRKITGGGHKVHSTIDEKEFNRDIYLLTGRNSKYYNNKKEYAGSYKLQNKNLPYNDGFKNLTQVFNVLNNIFDYIVLRNFEYLPDNHKTDLHGDIDLLFDGVKSKIDAVYILEAKNVFPNDEHRVHYCIKIDGEDVFFDFRYAGDKYYCEQFEKDLLENKYYDKQKKIFYPSQEDYFYSLIYHAFIHKPVVSNEYLNRLYSLASELNIKGLKSFNDRNGYMSLLNKYMDTNDYKFEKPFDNSVFYNYQLAVLNSSQTINFDIPLTEINDYEKIIIDYIQNSQKLQLSADTPWPLVYHLSPMRENILNWYDFKENASVLELGAGFGALTGLLCNKCKNVISIVENEVKQTAIRQRWKDKKNLDVIVSPLNNLDINKRFDYIILIGIFEYAKLFFTTMDPQNDLLLYLSKFLNPKGKILIATENKYGLKFFSGVPDDHTGNYFDSINGYFQNDYINTFDRNTIKNTLIKSGFTKMKFFYPMPDYKLPGLIYSDEYLPKAGDITGVRPFHLNGGMIVFDERNVWQNVVLNDAFKFLANSFLIEAGKDSASTSDIFYAKISQERQDKFKVSTIIKKNVVEKLGTTAESLGFIANIKDNENNLRSRGINILKSITSSGKLTYKFQDLNLASDLIIDILKKEELILFFKYINKLKDNIEVSSPETEWQNNILYKLGYAKENEKINFGKILNIAYIDMIFSNCFISKDDFLFFDQEWTLNNTPSLFVLYRAINELYSKNIWIQDVIDILLVFEKIGITKRCLECFQKLEEYFQLSVVNTGTRDYLNVHAWFEKDTLFSFINSVNLDHEKIITEKNQEILNRDGHIELLLESERLLQGEVLSKTGHIEQLMESERLLNIELNNKNGHIEQLIITERRLNSDINSILNSRTYKLASKISLISRKMFPIYSKRRFFAKLVYKFLKNPIKFLFKITPKRIGLFFHVLKTEGTAGASRRINNHMADKKLPEYSQELKVIANIENQTNIDDYKSIEFKKENKPVVSIIIPVYNQFNYTYNCLKSIIENSGDKINYEIIIANDCSTDLTTQIEKVVKNIKVITTTKNLRFLKNCNNAAKHARGKYILFLNNDTQVQENWLLPLVELIEKDDKTGTVGSKLIYENGMLQEAGGIFWNDASAWNYGKMSDSSLPEYNYVKEVDYISGAALMIKKSLWDKLGGFDEEFAPAYCEDADICFSIRKMGYKVMYQPASVVVHFEGISNGTDVSEGQKQYQVVNQKKFFEKWENVLEKEHYPNGLDVFYARDRSRSKKTILFVDHYVPMYDKDAGSRAVFHYVNLFVDYGYNVKFIGDNFYKHEPYTAVLNQLGVEVLYGNYYFHNWQSWIKQNSKYINLVILNRPHITCKYIDLLKQFPNIKIAYWGHDLHFLRERREYEINKNKKLIESSKKWEELEFSIMKKANISHFFSNIEIDIIKSKNIDIKARMIPINIYKNIKKKNILFKDRKDLLFVGGFSHNPNIDAVLWFCKGILPTVLIEYPDIKLIIVGSNVPDEIKQLESENIIIKGYVTDDELERIYNLSRISVVPLRYGAGVKGKVIEAIYNQLPVITTSIGAEGIKDAERCLFIKDDPVDFAKEIIRVYNDFKTLEEKSDKSYHYICENFSEDAAISVLREDNLI